MEYEKAIELDEEEHLKAYTNYRNVDRIYSLASEFHGEDNMRSPRTWVYNLSSKEIIAEIIRNGGEYILLKHREEPVGLVCFCFGFRCRPRDNPDRILKIDEWEVGSLLIHEDFRGKGSSRPLFKLAIERLKEKTEVEKAFVIVTGTFDRKRLGEPREMSRGVVTLCKELDGKLIGYGKDSFGPVYELDIRSLKKST